ncbi:alpha/beta hydrolase fold domain-containing protein [Corynebacterium otitidis]
MAVGRGAEPATDTRRIARRLGRGAAAAAGGLLAGCGLVAGWLAASPYLPRVPYLGVGTLVTPQYAGPLAVGAAGLAGAAGLVALAGARRLGLAAGALLVASTVGFATLFGQQVSAARDLGVDVDPLAALRPAGLDEGAAPDETVAYDSGPDGELLMDVYLPEHRPAAGAPVLLYIHGGGWDSMDRSSQARNMRWAAEQGFVALAPDYTLATQKRPTWRLAAGQVSCALSWVTEHAAELGGIPGRLFTYGESAGGALAMAASYDAASGRTRPDCGGEPAVPRAVYADSPAIDPRAIATNPDPAAGPGSRETVEKYLGGPPEEHPDRANAVTVANLVDDNSQPTFLARSDADRLVPPESYPAFREAMAAHGRELTEIVRPRADHASALSFHGVWNQVLRETMLRFFADHGAFGPGAGPEG